MQIFKNDVYIDYTETLKTTLGWESQGTRCNNVKYTHVKKRGRHSDYIRDCERLAR